MTPPRDEVLAALFAADLPTGRAALCRLPDGLHLKVGVRGDRRLVCAWYEVGKRLTIKLCEEIGEDAGFYEPIMTRWTCAESQRAYLIGEGFRGQLCLHQWSNGAHFRGHLQFGLMTRCTRCGVVATQAHARRGERVTYEYDEWELREHIYRRWCRCGPVPGSLVAQPHHLKGAAS